MVPSSRHASSTMARAIVSVIPSSTRRHSERVSGGPKSMRRRASTLWTPMLVQADSAMVTTQRAKKNQGRLIGLLLAGRRLPTVRLLRPVQCDLRYDGMCSPRGNPERRADIEQMAYRVRIDWD